MTKDQIGYYLLPIFRIFIFAFFILAWLFPLGLIVNSNLLPDFTHSLVADTLTYGGMILVVLGALLMMFNIFPLLNFHNVYVRQQKSLIEFLKGCSFGIGIMLVCAVLVYLSDHVDFTILSISGGTFALYSIYFLFVAIFEEFLFRTYSLYVFAERFPFRFAVAINGILFALAHFSNPSFTILAALNIALAGILFAIYTLKSGSIARAVGIHFTWNFTQSVVLGYNVSGTKVQGLMKAIPKGADYISGGEFGIEGSVWSTLLLVLSIIWIVFKKQPTTGD